MKKKMNIKKLIGVFVFLSLLFSIGYAIVRIANTPAVAAPGSGAHLRSDYVLMLIQCCLGLVVIGIPTALEKRFSFSLPNGMSIACFIFLY